MDERSSEAFDFGFERRQGIASTQRALEASVIDRADFDMDRAEVTLDGCMPLAGHAADNSSHK
jgi:hypothetical protein